MTSNNSTNNDKKRKSTCISTNNNAVNGDVGSNSTNNRLNYTVKYNKYQQHQYLQNPKRGGPGILLTCETGREYKARNEALEILQQDWITYQQQQQQSDSTEKSTTSNSAGTNTPITTTSEGNPAKTNYSNSLDDELKQLHSNRMMKNKSSSSSHKDFPFVIYETGCKGTVLILYQNQNHPSTTTSTSINTSITNNNHHKTNNISDTISNEATQNMVVTDECTAASGQIITATTTPAATNNHTNHEDDIWDPCHVIYRIVNDMKLKSPIYTSSRYISRMIPIQKTCYATIDDIVITVQTLLEPIVKQHNQKKQQQVSLDGATNDNNTKTIIETVNDTKTTFAIQEKRRFCNHIKREPLIIAVGNVVGTMTNGNHSTDNNNSTTANNNNNNEWIVNLSKPDYTIWIDICKTIAGISIISDIHLYPKNFNLVEYRLSLLIHDDAITGDNNENIENDGDCTTTQATTGNKETTGIESKIR
jgi:tRNA(Ser,Leu) C12 N-acetylase TAN1